LRPARRQIDVLHGLLMGCTASSHLLNTWENTVRNDNVPELLRLLNQDFDVNQRGAKGMTPLHIACENYALVVFEFLMHNGADASAVDDEGNCPLHYAASCGSQTMVKQLLDRAPETINLLNQQRMFQYAFY